MRRSVLVFVKSPRTGAVKTRLAAAVGDAAAAELYRLLAEEEVRRTAPGAGEYDRLFFHTPAEDRPAMEAWFPGESWHAQAGADLGDGHVDDAGRLLPLGQPEGFHGDLRDGHVAARSPPANGE